MQESTFINKQMSVWFDLLRIGSACMVLIGHGGQLGFLGADWPLDDTFQHAAVVVFFVMSGALVHHSASRDGINLASFFQARAVRILPVALFSLLLGLVVFVFLLWYKPDAKSLIETSNSSATNIVAATLFLSEQAGRTEPVLNPPYWSLCYEVWFYALFGVMRFTSGPVRVVGIICVSIIAGINVLLLFPTWLLGVWVSAYGQQIGVRRPGISLATATAGFAWLSWSGLPHGILQILQNAHPFFNSLRFSSYFITDCAAALCASLGIIALRTIRLDVSMLRQVARWAAGISFSLYLTHWPLLIAMRVILPTSWHSARAIAAIIVPVLFAATIAPFLERRSGRVRSQPTWQSQFIPAETPGCRSLY